MRPLVHGLEVDSETRCAHWRSKLDVIAIRMKCCGLYYACKDCHEVLAGHAIETWPESEWHIKAVLCGVCGREMSILDYLASNDACPFCKAPFNPGCRHHRHFYFGTGSAG